MRLAEFILHDMEAILVQWEAFAATLLPAATGLGSLALRDHAQHILEAVARDLSSPQTRDEQSEKSKGRAPKVEGAPETAAQTHAVLRARSGFDINQLVAEYRALRASVLRLWMDFSPLDKTAFEDMIRFNEAIDQAVAESVGHFHRTVEGYRNLLLGMLGHDMRTPLNAIVITASYLSALNAGEEVSEASARLIRSGSSMQALLDDLTDFNRTNLGLGLKVVPSDVDLAKAADDELEQLRAAYPDRRIEFAASGDTCGRWDAARVQQILRNLVSNAIQYGSPDMPVHVNLRGEPSGALLEVRNSGHIDPSEVPQIFDPLKRGAAERASHEAQDGLGLGLFIVREIAKAHGGEVHARCEGEQTTFAVSLPRQ
ncbi:MAG TPA: sensor histidine kinase [Thermoanaerobaculia bacterium]|nr:sensor histidine kinase [Thermoanaerobaculia bacterium]